MDTVNGIEAMLGRRMSVVSEVFGERGRWLPASGFGAFDEERSHCHAG
jgi:hypothetical protein